MPDLVAVYGIDIGNETAFGMRLTPTLHERMDGLEEAIIHDMLRREPLLQ